MRLLLDTQVMLWWLLNYPRLGPETRELNGCKLLPGVGRQHLGDVYISTVCASYLWHRLPFVIRALWFIKFLLIAC